MFYFVNNKPRIERQQRAVECGHSEGTLLCDTATEKYLGTYYGIDLPIVLIYVTGWAEYLSLCSKVLTFKMSKWLGELMKMSKYRRRVKARKIWMDWVKDDMDKNGATTEIMVDRGEWTRKELA